MKNHTHCLIRFLGEGNFPSHCRDMLDRFYARTFTVEQALNYLSNNCRMITHDGVTYKTAISSRAWALINNCEIAPDAKLFCSFRMLDEVVAVCYISVAVDGAEY